MSAKFQASLHNREEVTYLKLAGVIDEDNELAGLSDKLGGGTVIVDLAEVERINSCGVRDWVNWLSRVEQNGAQVILVECSPAMVAQVNLVSNFTGKGVVKSFYAPYFCPSCDSEKVLLVEVGDLSGSPPKAPACRCDECDGTMDFDDMEESYFAFLTNAKKPISDPRVDSVISEFTPTDGERKIRARTGGSNPGSVPGKVGASSVHSSLPATPSVPNLRTLTGVGSNPGLGLASGVSGVRSAAAALAELEARRAQTSRAPLSPARSNTAWLVVLGLIVVAFLLLAFVLFGARH